MIASATEPVSKLRPATLAHIPTPCLMFMFTLGAPADSPHPPPSIFRQPSTPRLVSFPTRPTSCTLSVFPVSVSRHPPVIAAALAAPAPVSAEPIHSLVQVPMAALCKLAGFAIRASPRREKGRCHGYMGKGDVGVFRWSRGRASRGTRHRRCAREGSR